MKNSEEKPDIKFIRDIADNSFTDTINKINYKILENIFIVFISIDDIIYLIYSNKSNSIIFYNLIDFKKMGEIRSAHNNDITNFRHILDTKNEMDLIISISGFDRNIKLWNLNNCSCLANIEKAHKIGFIRSACFLNVNNNIFILSSSYSNGYEPVILFNLKGEKVKSMKKMKIGLDDNNSKINFIDTYYDKNNNKNYIILGCDNYCISYDYTDNKLFQKYEKENHNFYNAFIHIRKNNLELISCGMGDYYQYMGSIFIWDYITGKELYNIQNYYKYLGFCLYNDDYLLIGSNKGKINITKIQIKRNITELEGHKGIILSIKKIVHQRYGEYIISQDSLGYLKLWKA